MELLEALNTMVKLLFGARAINPGSLPKPVKLTVNGDSTSREASTTLSTGVGPKTPGCNGLDTKALKAKPLLVWVLLGEL
jgi:hypothetical protein